VKVRRFSQEVRLTSPSGHALEWLAGAYYSQENASNSGSTDPLDSRLAPIPSLPSFFAADYPTTYKETAFFGTLTYKITPAFDVTGGLRWLTNAQTVEQNVVSGPAIHTVAQAAGDATNYAMGARYHLGPDTMVYARVASGYEPGVANTTLATYPQIPLLTNPDKMVNYELGIKTDLLDHRATLDLSLFKMNWSDLQIIVPTPDGLVAYYINAGKVTTEGFELSATFALKDVLHVSFNTAYMDAYAVEALPAAQITAGARFGLPVWTAAASVDYRLHDVAQWTPRFDASWRYTDSCDPAGFSSQLPQGRIPSYSTVDLNLEVTRGRVTASLYARNLLDVRAYNFGALSINNTTGAHYFSGTVAEPRVIGLSSRVKF